MNRRYQCLGRWAAAVEVIFCLCKKKREILSIKPEKLPFSCGHWQIIKLSGENGMRETVA